MRTIEYRGKRLHDGVWVYGTPLIVKKREVAMIVTFHQAYPDTLAKFTTSVDHNSLGQFTGLTDKNDTPIYEGDIVRHDENGKCYSIIYEAPMFRFAPNDDMFAFLNHPELLEVVGNIYDNKDLLERGGKQ